MAQAPRRHMSIDAGQGGPNGLHSKNTDTYYL